MRALLADIAVIAMTAVAYLGGIWLSVLLAVIVFVCLVGAVMKYGERMDQWDRLGLGGLAGSMLMTTAAIFVPNSPFNDWSFGLSRFFLAVICVKRFGIPIFWSLVTTRRVKQNAKARYRNVL